jgi:hypothetical protein
MSKTTLMNMVTSQNRLLINQIRKHISKKLEWITVVKYWFGFKKVLVPRPTLQVPPRPTLQVPPRPTLQVPPLRATLQTHHRY